MPAIYPVATRRVSEQLLQARLQSQFEFDRLDLLRLQDQLSTGLRLSLPSDDAPAAARAVTLQRLLEQKQQVITNVDTTSSYVAATDNALARVSELLTSIRASALSAVDTTISDNERRIVAEEVQRAIDQLINIGNQQFRGRYLFAGSKTAQAPFEIQGANVVYQGNEADLQSLVDANYLLDANVTGDEVFGAISSVVRGTADLDPVLTLDTRLSTLRGGLGIDKGSFLISDGTSTKTVSIASAETVGDVVRLIESNPPDGRQVTVQLTNNALVIDIDDAGGGNLTVREVSGGTTAQQLGIFNSLGVGINQLSGSDLSPRLQPTTQLADLFGSSGVVFDKESGIQIVNGGQTHTITFETAETVEDLLNLLNGSTASVSARIAADGRGIEVRSRLSGADFKIGENGGTTATELGIRTLIRETQLAELNFGGGVDLTGGNDALLSDPNFVGSGEPHVDFTIQRDGLPDLDIDIRSARTVGDVIDLVNTHPDNQGASPVTARLAEFGNGIQIIDQNNVGPPALTIVRRDSFAAWDLGLIQRGEDSGQLLGADVNPAETKGVFNSLLRLSAALGSSDFAEIGRVVEMLDDDFERLTFSRGDLGARTRSLDVLAQRVQDEDVQLRASLSEEIDADLVKAISELSARQASIEATLRLIGQTLQLTVLNFI